MRIALISMLDAPGVHIAGRPPAWHQLQAALALSCERIVCLADAPGADLAMVQREAERRGATFHAITHHRALSGLVSAADTLLVFAPGVMPDSAWLVQSFGGRAAVAVLPAAVAVELGFERIDRDRAWAGVLATRGDAVETLADLAPDADPIAGLLRVALQRGATAVTVPDGWVSEGEWALLATAAAAERYQAAWYARRVPAPPPQLPGEVLSHRVARALLERIGDARTWSTAVFAAGLALAVGGGTTGYLGQALAGLSLLAAGVFAGAVGAALGRFTRAGTGEAEPRWHRATRHTLSDAALIAIAASPREFEGWSAAFPALVLVAAIRLAEEAGAPRVVWPFRDRLLVTAVLGAAAAAGVFVHGLAILSLAALGLRLFWSRGRS